MSIRRACQKSDTTPPGSLAKEPLTPPPSKQKSGTTGKQIIQVIEDRKRDRGYPTSYWQRFKLSPVEYKYVEQRLRHQVKYCYIIPIGWSRTPFFDDIQIRLLSIGTPFCPSDARILARGTLIENR